MEQLFNNIEKETEKELEKVLNNYEIINIYDLENITGCVDTIKLNSIMSKSVFKDVDFKSDKPGGMILFSTDLNTTIKNEETFIDKIVYFFRNRRKVFLNNRLRIDGKLNKLLLDSYGIKGYILSKSYNGIYKTKTEKVFSKKSYTITINGAETKLLKLIATEICKHFKQETIMLADFNSEKPTVYIITPLPMSDSEKSEQKPGSDNLSNR